MKTNGLPRLFILLLHPVRLIVDIVHKLFPASVGAKVKKHHLHFAVGVILMFIGSSIASTEAHSHYVHLILDTMGYSLHAMGCAPIIKVVADIVGMEV